MKTLAELDHELHRLLAEREQLAAAEAEQEPALPSLPSETDEEWIARHGGAVARISGWTLCDDAAMADPHGTRWEAPSPLDSGALGCRLKHLRRIASQWLRQTERDFQKCRDAALGLDLAFSWTPQVAERYGPPPAAAAGAGRLDAVACLRHLKNFVHAARAAWTEITCRIALLPEEQAHQVMLSAERDSASAAMALGAEVQNIAL